MCNNDTNRSHFLYFSYRKTNFSERFNSHWFKNLPPLCARAAILNIAKEAYPWKRNVKFMGYERSKRQLLKITEYEQSRVWVWKKTILKTVYFLFFCLAFTNYCTNNLQRKIILRTVERAVWKVSLNKYEARNDRVSEHTPGLNYRNLRTQEKQSERI